MAKKRQVHLSFYIVCEGENTEPKYLNSIRNHIKKHNLWGDIRINIKISPEPSIDENEDSKISKHKTQRQKRKLKRVVNTDIPLVENTYKAIPTRYVREAQL